MSWRSNPEHLWESNDLRTVVATVDCVGEGAAADAEIPLSDEQPSEPGTYEDLSIQRNDKRVTVRVDLRVKRVDTDDPDVWRPHYVEAPTRKVAEVLERALEGHDGVDAINVYAEGDF
jgi:hypothetical protein